MLTTTARDLEVDLRHHTVLETLSAADNITQVNRMSRSRRVLAIGGKQRILRLDMVCFETILFHLDSL